MIDRHKRFLKRRETDSPDLGNFIHWHIIQNKIKKKVVSDYLGVRPTTLNQYFKQPSFQWSILWRVCQAINQNLIMDLGERLGIPYETKAEKALKAVLEEKEKEIATMKIQIEVYKKIHKIE